MKNLGVIAVLSFFVAFISGCMTNLSQRNDLTQLPMYGQPDIKRSNEMKAIDDAFIERVTNDLGDRNKASQLWVDQGFRFYSQNRIDMAMKRFNQAWLLNPEEPQVYWGFSSVLHDRGKNCEAKEMMKKGLLLGLGNNDPSALADAGRIYVLCAVTTSNKKEKNKYLKKSFNLYVDASLAAPNMAYIYSSWATASYWTGEYEHAWKMVLKAEELGGGPSERFMELLSRKMERPL